MVWEAAQAVHVPVVGIGGIMDAMDALEFLTVGAHAVQVGTANFVNPRATEEIVEGLASYLAENNFTDIGQIIGSLRISRQ
jgi:dihydroorotate dehydrogenase (NAD+) catalytic subunit